jgi:lysophospholipase L1-like esterase
VTRRDRLPNVGWLAQRPALPKSILSLQMPFRTTAPLAALLLTASLFSCRTALGQPAEAATADAHLHVGSLGVGKILFLGNSITLHGPAPDIGWLGNWGMAASAADKDYVHLLTGEISKAADGKPEVMVKNIADFERQLDKYDLKTGLKPELDFHADLVIVAIGENAAALTTDEGKARFAASFASLLAELKQHGNPTLIVRSSFWADPPKDQLMERACQEAGGVFVNIAKLGGDETNFARSERKIEHAGVAGHPGDKGMQAIAAALWAAIQEHAAKKP